MRPTFANALTPLLVVVVAGLSACPAPGDEPPAPGSTPQGELVAGADASDALDLAIDSDRGRVVVVVEERDDVAVYAEIDGDESAVDIDLATSGQSIDLDVAIADDDTFADIDVRMPEGLQLEIQSFGDTTTVGAADTVTIHALAGDVDVSLSPSDGAQVTAQATGGSVSFVGLDFQGVNTAGNATGTLAGGGDPITVDAEDGGITFRAL